MIRHVPILLVQSSPLTLAGEGLGERAENTLSRPCGAPSPASVRGEESCQEESSQEKSSQFDISRFFNKGFHDVFAG